MKPLSSINDLIVPQLQTNTLMLADQGIADDGCQLLLAEGVNGMLLKNVDLRGNRITSAGLQKVVLFLHRSGNIEVLALNWNDLENDNAAGLEALEKFMRSPESSVRHLDLRNSNLTMNSADHLCGILASNSLRYVDLSWNSLNDTIVPKMVRSLNSRQYPIHVELKGAGLTPSGLDAIVRTLKDLEARFPPTSDVRMNMADPLTDVEGRKKLILDNLYHNERVRKIHEDSGRVILNPDTAELEILMSEMMKKKIVMKDRLLRDIDDRIKHLHDIEVEVDEMNSMRDRASNENMALRRELEHLKTIYSKSKQSFQIEQEGLATQASGLSSLMNKRNIEARAAVDKLLHAEKMRAREYANKLEEQESLLVEKIKTITIDRDRLNKDLATIKEKMAFFMQTFNSRLREVEITAKLEEKARAEFTHGLIESRILTINEGRQMMQRRANDALLSLADTEESMLARIEQLHHAIADKKRLTANLDEAIQTVQTSNERLINEDINLDSKMTKIKDELLDVIDKVKVKKDLIEQHALEWEDGQEKDLNEVRMARESAEDTISELEANLRKLRLEMDRLDTKREHIVERVNRRVVDVIAEMARKYQ